MIDESTRHEFLRPTTHNAKNLSIKDDTEEIEPQNKKARGRNKTYKVLCSFRDFPTADSTLKNVFDNQKWRKGNLKGSDKRYYTCVSSGTKSDCPVSMYLYMHSDSQVCSVYMSNEEHNHQEKREVEKNRLSLNVRDEIIRIYENETQNTNMIIEKLYQKKLKVSKIQIYNLIHRYKSMQHEPRNNMLNELKQYCLDHQNLPADLDEVFISDSYFQSDLSFIEDFRIFLTTRRLISLATEATHICIVTTYKLLWQGFPVILIGTTDSLGTFNPFGITVCKQESENDYAFTFKALKTQLKQLCNYDLVPTALVADAGASITNAFKSIFDNDFRRVICWNHVIRRVDTRLNMIKDVNIRKAVRKDITDVKVYAEMHNFKLLTSQMLRKWGDYRLESVDLFKEYFEEQWLREPNCAWYEAFAPNIPTTNNALDSINSVIKSENTFRKRLPVSDFFDMVSTKLLRRWSCERSENYASPNRFK